MRWDPRLVSSECNFPATTKLVKLFSPLTIKTLNPLTDTADQESPSTPKCAESTLILSPRFGLINSKCTTKSEADWTNKIPESYMPAKRTERADVIPTGLCFQHEHQTEMNIKAVIWAYLEIMKPVPPMTWGAQKMPSTKPVLFILMTPGIPVIVEIQNIVAATNWIELPRNPISFHRAPTQIHCCLRLSSPSSAEWVPPRLWKWCVHSEIALCRASPKQSYDYSLFWETIPRVFDSATPES